MASYGFDLDDCLSKDYLWLVIKGFQSQIMICFLYFSMWYRFDIWQCSHGHRPVGVTYNYFAITPFSNICLQGAFAEALTRLLIDE